MKKHIFAVTVAGLFSIGAFAQASAPAGAPSQAGVATQEASAANDAQAAPANDEAAPVKP